ncbi:MAG: hypothetical protein WCU80_10455, partial [Paludibacteraceae bacterium]
NILIPQSQSIFVAWECAVPNRNFRRGKAHPYRMPATTSAVFLQIDNSYGINSKSPSTQSIQSIIHLSIQPI